jgi:hypothetical protein
MTKDVHVGVPQSTHDAPCHRLPIHRELRMHRNDYEIQLFQCRIVKIQCAVIEDVHFGAF